MTDIEIRVTSRLGSRAGFQGAEREAKNLRGELERTARAADIDGRVDMDLAEVRNADREVRDLDSIPDPVVEIDTNADEAVDSIEQAFGDLDVSSAGQTIVSQLGTALGAAGPLGALALGVGATLGDDLVAGFDRGLNARRNSLTFAVENNLDAAGLRSVGRVGGEAYADGFGDGLAELRANAALVLNELAGLDSGLDLGNATRQAQALADVFGVEVPKSIRVARRLVANDLVADVDKAFNLIGQTAQDFRLDFDDILDVADEFAPVFAKLGIDGAQAFQIIGRAVQEGLLPNIDRVAELFEEFNIEMTDSAGRARPAIDALGLSFESLQERIASGDGAAALTEVTAALLDIGDEARRNELAMEIFGTSIESAADPERVLQLLATADAVGDIGTAADDAAESIEASAGGFERAQRGVEGFSAHIGALVDGRVASLFGDFETGAAANESAWEALGNAVQSAGQKIADVEFTSLEGQLERVDGVMGALREGLPATATRLTDVGEVANNAERRFAGLAAETAVVADEVRGLDDALADFAGRFNEDRIFRSIEEDTRRALEATSELTAASFSLGEGFDTTTEAGAAAEEALERLSGNLDDLIRAQQDGTVTGAELAAGQAEVRASVQQVAEQMNLTEGEAAALIAKYSDFPAEVITDVIARDLATSSIAEIARDIRLLPNEKVITIRTRTAGPRRINFSGFADQFSATGGISSRATGGIGGVDRPLARLSAAQTGGARDNLTLVGEEGPELVRLGVGSNVSTFPDTQRMAMTGALGGGGVTNNIVQVMGSVVADRDIVEIAADAFRSGDFTQFGIEGGAGG